MDKKGVITQGSWALICLLPSWALGSKPDGKTSQINLAPCLMGNFAEDQSVSDFAISWIKHSCSLTNLGLAWGRLAIIGGMVRIGYWGLGHCEGMGTTLGTTLDRIGYWGLDHCESK